MADRDDEVLSEEEAARVWGISARLQAEAGDRAEVQEIAAAADTERPGYAIEQVRAAAQEAGIGDEFIDAALVEIRADRALSHQRGGHWLARRFLKDPPDAITVRRVIDAPPADVFEVMKTVLPAEPFRLTLTDQEGDPLDGGFLRFDLPGMKGPFERGFAFETSEAGLRELFVSLRGTGGTEAACELTVRSPVTSHNLGLGVGVVATALGAAAVGAIGLATGLGPIVIVGGGVVGAGLGVRGFRGLYGYAMRRARRALEGLVGAVATRVTGTWHG